MHDPGPSPPGAFLPGRDDEALRRTSRAWTAFSILGIGGWIGLTVLVAVRHDDPTDATPVLRTFAIGGGIFFGALFGAAALQIRRSQGAATDALYVRLAGGDVPAATRRSVARTTRSIASVYLVFGAVTTGLVLLGIGLANERIAQVLLTVAVGLVILWAAYSSWALTRTYRATDDLFAPLGLRITETPTYLPNALAGGGHLAGALTYEGVRHGRTVTITQTATEAITRVSGAAAPRADVPVEQMVASTGEPHRCWNQVAATAGVEGVLVRRSGHGAGRWFLHDLALAEALAGPAT
jgi:hypothetical protein